VFVQAGLPAVSKGCRLFESLLVLLVTICTRLAELSCAVLVLWRWCLNPQDKCIEFRCGLTKVLENNQHRWHSGLQGSAPKILPTLLAYLSLCRGLGLLEGHRTTAYFRVSQAKEVALQSVQNMLRPQLQTVSRPASNNTGCSEHLRRLRRLVQYSSAQFLLQLNSFSSADTPRPRGWTTPPPPPPASPSRTSPPPAPSRSTSSSPSRGSSRPSKPPTTLTTCASSSSATPGRCARSTSSRRSC
jgi:hypothetical protein